MVIPEGSIWNKVSAIGGIGFTLMIPILAGFIAMSIAGRAALALSHDMLWLQMMEQY
ncbi:hypothetical protein Q5M85_06150 [Paraclostridium bifermentans]|nr:hypothetical protein [Paraclostridium bifermentans]